MFNEEKKIIYDLQLNEEKNYIPTLNIVYLPHSKKFIHLELTNAKIPFNKLIPIIQEAIKSADNLYKLYINIDSNCLISVKNKFN